MSDSIEDRFKAMPPITRGWFVAALLTTVATVLGFASPLQLYLDLDLVVNKFHIWRLVTNFIFFGKFGMPFAFQLYLLCKICYAYEENPFAVGTHIAGGRSSADFAMLLIISGLIQTGIAYLMGLPFLGPSLVFSVLYVWSRKNAEQPMSFFGIPFKGIHYPWVMLAFSVILGNSPVTDLIGIFSGHVFYFLVEVVPNFYQDSFPKALMLQTPQLLFDMFDESAPGGRPAAAQRNWGAFAGQGHALGGR